MLRSLRWIGAILDRRDERLACVLREEYGQRRRLLSWTRDPDGLWRARISGPGVVRTLERTGRTRTQAAEAAAAAMDRLLIARFTLRCQADQFYRSTTEETSL
jgi:hypothetical protein